MNPNQSHPWDGAIHCHLSLPNQISRLQEVADIIQNEAVDVLISRALQPESERDRFAIVTYGRVGNAVCRRISHQQGAQVAEGEIHYLINGTRGRPRRLTCRTDVFIRPGAQAIFTTLQDTHLLSQVWVEGNSATFSHWYVQDQVRDVGTITVAVEQVRRNRISQLTTELAEARDSQDESWRQFSTALEQFYTSPMLLTTTGEPRILQAYRDAWYQSMKRTSHIELQIRTLQASLNN